jgi:hypothetical protein
MTSDPRVEREIKAQPYPLLFATISGALEVAHQSSGLTESPAGRGAINQMLVRLRMRTV